MAVIRLTQHNNVIDTRHLGDSDIVLIGRGASCDVVIPDKTRRVSRYHAAIVRVNDPVERHFIRDLGSVEGVRVANAFVYQKFLQRGDLIDIGPYRLIYLLDDASDEQ